MKYIAMMMEVYSIAVHGYGDSIVTLILLQSRLEDSFQVFASRYISKGSVSSKQTYESRIIFGFRQFNAECRSPEVTALSSEPTCR